MAEGSSRLSRQQRRRLRDAQRRSEARHRELQQRAEPDVAAGARAGAGGVGAGVGGSGGASEELQASGWPVRVGFFAACAVFLIAAMVTAAVATPALGGGWDGWLLVAGAGVCASAGTAAAFVSRQVRLRERRVAAATVAVLAVLYLWGATTQVVIDGRPHLHTSETAQAWRLSQQLLGDMSRMAELDVLLSYDLVAARSNLRRYDPAAVELSQIAARWATTEISTVPDDRFIPVMRHLATSADFGAQAMRRKYELALQYDARAEAELQSWRATFVRELLTAGPLLAELSDHYGFDLVPREGGVAE
jgi:hypothetical protein